MIDEEVRQQIERTDAFIAAFRALIASTVVDPASPSRLPAIAGLERIAATLDAVDYVTFCNLANVNAALRGGLLDLLGVQLMCVGQGPTLDYVDAKAFLDFIYRPLMRVSAEAPANLM